LAGKQIRHAAANGWLTPWAMDAERVGEATPPLPKRAWLLFSEITETLPDEALIVRTPMNTWQDAAVIEEIDRIAPGGSRHHRRRLEPNPCRSGMSRRRLRALLFVRRHRQTNNRRCGNPQR